ncbi:MAG: glutamate--tRNA ligase [Nitratiruptor sp.]|nr:glutamate--tRNA ligase [Nitratiruptor sp.]NPA84129.1 glutamate--tRNA ligase [Campylobacterota bacterium]
MLRFAPSPTGDLHIGNLRVALINYILAKQRREPFLVRIEDTDTQRNVEGKDREILEILQRFGIEYDQLLYQSQNLHFHQQLAFKLLQEGKAFPCFCTPEELERERQRAKEEGRPYRYSGKCAQRSLAQASRHPGKFSIRIKKPEAPITFQDRIKGFISFDPFDVDSFVILRADGRPTYNFACAIDDMLSDVSLVVRGEDHLSNTPKQIHIRQELGYSKAIEYAHLPMILNQEGKKMSKREQGASVRWLLEEGYLPEAIANYLLLLGNKTPTEIFTLQEAIQWFDLANLSRAPARFDLEKLRFINRAHLRRKGPQELAALLGIEPAQGALAAIYLEEASTLKELRAKIEPIFAKDRDLGEFEREGELLRQAIAGMGELPAEFEVFKGQLMEATGLRGKQFFKPLRILMTGLAHGPELHLLYPHLRDHIQKVVQ